MRERLGCNRSLGLDGAENRGAISAKNAEKQGAGAEEVKFWDDLKRCRNLQLSLREKVIFGLSEIGTGRELVPDERWNMQQTNIVSQ